MLYQPEAVEIEVRAVALLTRWQLANGEFTVPGRTAHSSRGRIGQGISDSSLTTKLPWLGALSMGRGPTRHQQFLFDESAMDHRNDRAAAPTLEPAFASAPSQVGKRIGPSHRRFEQPAELFHRFNPAVTLQSQSLEDRRNMIGNRQSRGSSNLSAGPIQNRKILVELDRRESLIAADIDRENGRELLEPLVNPVLAMLVVVSRERIDTAQERPAERIVPYSDRHRLRRWARSHGGRKQACVGASTWGS